MGRFFDTSLFVYSLFIDLVFFSFSIYFLFLNIPTFILGGYELSISAINLRYLLYAWTGCSRLVGAYDLEIISYETRTDIIVNKNDRRPRHIHREKK